jgi:putative spermidine/putrescine transport system permease protein
MSAPVAPQGAGIVATRAASVSLPARATRARAGWLTERRVNRVLAWLWVTAFFVFLLAPLLVVIVVSFGEAAKGGIAFPPKALTLRWYATIERDYLVALAASVAVATASVVCCVLLGVPAALGLVRSRLRGKAMLAAAFRMPVQIPAVVTGVAFLQFYYVLGDAMGWYGAGTWTGLLVAHVFIGLPYVVGSVVAVVQRFNVRLEEAALILGASPWSALTRVTLPVIAPGIYSGATYAFLVSFSDLPVALFLSSADVKTFPVLLFQAMDYEFDPSLLAVATIIIAASFVAMLLFQKWVGINTLLKSGQ